MDHKNALALFGFALWEHWVHRLTDGAAHSSWALLKLGIKLLLTKKGDSKSMEPTEQKLGDVGSMKIGFAGGKATFDLTAAAGPASASVHAQIDAGVLIDEIKAAVEAKFPGAMPIEEAIFALLKETVTKL